MSNILIATPIFSDLGVITAGSQTADMNAENLLKIQPTDVLRAVDLNNVYVVEDLLAAKTINLAALMFHNGTSASQWRVRAATSEANLTAAPGYDSGLVDMWGKSGLDDDGWEKYHSFMWFGNLPKTYQWWIIDVSDLSNPAGYFQAGRLYLSNAFVPTINAAYGWGTGIRENSSRSQTSGSNTFSASRKVSRVHNFTLPFLSEDEMYGNVHKIERLRGNSRDVLVHFDVENGDRIMDWAYYGLMNIKGEINNPVFEQYEKKFEIEEIL